MATFPDLGLSLDTTIAVEHGIRLTPSESGASRGEAPYSEPQYQLELVWRGLSVAERDQLTDFIAANLTAANDIVISGHTYSLRLMPGGGPFVSPVGGLLWNVRMTARGTRTVVV